MKNSCKYSVCSDNDSGLSIGKEYSSSFSSSHSTAPNSYRSPSFTQSISVKIFIVDLRKEIKYDLPPAVSVFQIHRNIIQKYGSKLVDPINYGLFIPHQLNKAGKFLREERLLGDYCSINNSNYLQFIYKHRIVWPDKSPSDMNKKINSKINHNRFIDYIIRNDPVKVKKALGKGLDPNFHCSSGETPLTLTAKLSKPQDVITALVSGGAHLDYRATDSLTPLHKAAISANYETLSILLNFGATPNCLDHHGMTPLYYSLMYDNSTKSLEKLLYEHAKIGVLDKRGLKEIHQVCRSGKSSHLDILLAYGAEINARTEVHLSTPLHVAAYTGKADCVRLLMLNGADRTLLNSSGRTAAQEARTAGYKAISIMIKEFQDSEIHDQPTFKAVWNQHRKKSEFDIALTNVRPRIGDTEFKEDELNIKGDRINGSEKGTPYPKDCNGHVTLRTKCSSRPVMDDKFANFFEPDTLSASSDFYCQTKSNGEKKRCLPKENIWRHSSLLSIDDSLFDNDHTSMWKVVLQRKFDSGYGIDLKDQSSDPSLPSIHVIRNVAPGSPASLAGLRSDDFVLEINDVNVRQANIQFVSKLFSQRPDMVVLTILRPKKTPESTKDPCFQYKKHSYQDSNPLRGFASADKKLLRMYSNYNLSSVAGTYALCESPVTLSSMNSILAGNCDQDQKRINFDKLKSLSRSNSPVYSQGLTQSQTYNTTPPISHMRSQIIEKKSILKNIEKSNFGGRDNVAKLKSRDQSYIESDIEDIPIPPPQPLIVRPIGYRYISSINKSYNYPTKTLSQSTSVDFAQHNREWEIHSDSHKTMSSSREPIISDSRKGNVSLIKGSTSEEDFCLPPPLSFQ